MGTTLQHGIFLPAEGERNCYAGLASNWTILDGVVGGYSSHAANLTIHVTAADKEAWNGKADASALTAHTGNTTIHVTAADKEAWNGKQDALSQTQLDAVNSGIDSSKVQQIATNASDISSLQSGKADDNSVVHRSGNETVDGFKQFANIRVTNSIKGINLDSTTTDLNNCYSDFSLYGESKGGNIQYYYCNTDSGTANISNLPEAKAFFLISITTRLISNSLYVKQTLVNSTNKTYTRYCNNGTWGSWVNETAKYVTIDTAQTISGNKTFSSINGVEPSSLSLPVTTGTIDISAYVTNLTGVNVNNYTPPANGYIVITCNSNNVDYIKVSNNLNFVSVVDNTNNQFTSGILGVWQPCVAGIGVQIRIKASALNSAKFIPCQGNI